MIVLIEFLAVVASGIYGILLARRARMDFLGIFTLAFVTALGGGTLRDVMLDRQPLFWIEHSHYPVVLFALTLLSFFVPRIPEKFKQVLNIPDALGLGLFSIVGAQYALDEGTTYFIAALFGVMTGCFGGVISDIIANKVPTLFRSAPLYATCSFFGCWCYFGLVNLNVIPPVAISLGVLVIVAARMAALRWDIRLPEQSE